MEITGRLIKILEPTRGESARGPWVRGGFVIEVEGEYAPRQVAFTTFGEDRLAMIQNLPLNSQVVVNFNPESREYNERWYTDLRATRVQAVVPGQMPAQSTGYGYTSQQQDANTQTMGAATNGSNFATAPGNTTFPSTNQPAGSVNMPGNDNDDLPF